MNHNKTTLALASITVAVALAGIAFAIPQQVLAVGTNSSVGRENPTQVPLSTHSPCPNKANSNSTTGNTTNITIGNSSHVVKDESLSSGNTIVNIASRLHRCPVIVVPGLGGTG
jgi:hypothetical protein